MIYSGEPALPFASRPLTLYLHIPLLTAPAGATARVRAATAAHTSGHDRSANASVAESATPAGDDSARSLAGDSIKTGTGTGVATGTATAATSIAAATNDDVVGLLVILRP